MRHGHQLLDQAKGLGQLGFTVPFLQGFELLFDDRGLVASEVQIAVEPPKYELRAVFVQGF